MSDSRAAVRYAKAVLEVAQQQKAIDAVERDMQSILETVADSRDLRETLASPIIQGEVKRLALLAIFKDAHAITKGLINTLVDNKRIIMLNAVALKFMILLEDARGKNVAFVTTAVPLTADLERKILAKVVQLTGNEVTIRNEVDESLIGGFVLRVGDQQFDTSIANQLRNLKRTFSKSL